MAGGLGSEEALPVRRLTRQQQQQQQQLRVPEEEEEEVEEEVEEVWGGDERPESGEGEAQQQQYEAAEAAPQLPRGGLRHDLRSSPAASSGDHGGDSVIGAGSQMTAGESEPPPARPTRRRRI